MMPPALVMNDYHQYATDNGSRHLVMVQAALQNMFPRLKVDSVKVGVVNMSLSIRVSFVVVERAARRATRL